jgi:small subunit ribosomal protein S7
MIKFNADPRLRKFIKFLMLGGKRGVAAAVISDCFKVLEEKEGTGQSSSFIVFHLALRKASPVLELRNVRRSGVVVQMPLGIVIKRRESFAMRWIISAARARKGSASMALKLADVFVDTALGVGIVIKRRDTLHRLADTSRSQSRIR